MQMKNYAAIALLAISLMACDQLKSVNSPSGDDAATPKKGEKVVKNFDVDTEASAKFKAQIKEKFPADSKTEAVEAGLKSMGFECRKDETTSANERGCDKMETKDTCIYMSIVKTLPFNPDGAQIIKVCDVAN